MAANHFTREELAQYILHSAEDTFIDKVKAMIPNENKEEIVAYTTKGKALSKKEYLEEIEKGKKAIEQGKYKTSSELRNIISSWGK